jgi:putative ABC transport system permease protein
LRRLLRPLVAAEWRAHPWRVALAVAAVALGVALAWSVHLINRSALSEFSAAVRAVQGEPDASLACGDARGCDERVLDTLAADTRVALATPLIEFDGYALTTEGQRLSLRLVAVDALQIAATAAPLLPLPAAGEARTTLVDPEAAFLNLAAAERLRLADGASVRLQRGGGTLALRVAGRVAAGGPPLAVIDLAAAQQHFGFAGRLTRIDLRLEPGARFDEAPPGWRLARAGDAVQRLSNLSRAYRVNLTVLALVALFVGAFLVFAVMALAVAQRIGALALLGVLGLSARERGALVWAEGAIVGAVGSALGVGAGTLLAQMALAWLAGDLGGGYFPGVAPTLDFAWPDALAFAALGVVAALVGAWLPSRQAARLSPAQALKGLGGTGAAPHASRWRGPALLTLGALLALAPPIAGLPLAAYLSVAVLLVGGIACVPLLIDLLLVNLAPLARPGRAIPRGDAGRPGSSPALSPLATRSSSALPLLAVARAHHEREAAAVAVAGVVASLALAVALTVMVASFRDGVAQWLDRVLPADLYLRSATRSGAADQAFLPVGLPEAAARIGGVARVEASRVRALSFAPERPSVTLIARPLGDAGGDAATSLPLLGAALPPDAARPGIFISEAVQRLYRIEPGDELVLPLAEQPLRTRVRGIWRDYARQFGAIAIELDDYRRATGDTRLNDLALRLERGADAAAVQRELRALLPEPALYDMASAPELRALSLAIFDRSFVVTRWLQAVAIAIGLAGIAASFAGQVWARRREFGLLAHLGVTRAQVIALVAGEGALWTAAGALMGAALGLAVSVVLVHVVNPQSFHWTMELLLPWGRIALLSLAVVAAGAATAAWAARAAASRDALLAVKEDW